MGYFDGYKIASAGEYLMFFLLESPDDSHSGKYSDLYDGTDQRHKDLTESVGFKDDYDSPELAIDLAVAQLEEAGLVVTTPLEGSLTDGEPDYLMTLTPEGLAFLEQNRVFPFRGVTL
jgi:hypothetical protein